MPEHGVRALRSCKHGIRGPAMGMVGKAWSSGALCVVQNPDTLPTMLHPRTKLEGAACCSPSAQLPAAAPALHACVTKGCKCCLAPLRTVPELSQDACKA